MQGEETRAARAGGRPSKSEALKLNERILEKAGLLFLSNGYGATSIEALAKELGISKRTFYHRFRDKADLFAAVVERLIERLSIGGGSEFFAEETGEKVFHSLARVILRAALAPEALALHRLLLGEARQFPELAAVMERQGARRGAIDHIAGLLERMFPALPGNHADARFAAEQFLHLICAEPQRRALGMHPAMTEAELDAWCDRSVELFLHGYAGSRRD